MEYGQGRGNRGKGLMVATMRAQPLRKKLRLPVPLSAGIAARLHQRSVKIIDRENINPDNPRRFGRESKSCPGGKAQQYSQQPHKPTFFPQLIPSLICPRYNESILDESFHRSVTISCLHGAEHRVIFHSQLSGGMF